MKHVDVKGKKVEELKNTEAKLRQELFELKMKKVTGQLKQTADVSKNRKNIARVLTAVNAQNLSTKGAK